MTDELALTKQGDVVLAFKAERVGDNAAEGTGYICRM